MDRLKSAILAVLSALAIAGCRDAIGPSASSARVPVPVRANSTVSGPSDLFYQVLSTPSSTTVLQQFPWDTWVALTATGSVTLNALAPIPGASPYYVYPGGSVGVTGRVDHHPNSSTPCVLNLSLSDARAGQAMDAYARTIDPAPRPASAIPLFVFQIGTSFAVVDLLSPNDNDADFMYFFSPTWDFKGTAFVQ